MSNARILTIADDRLYGESLEMFFALTSVQVIRANDLAGALAAVRHQPPDIVLLDAALPGFDASSFMAAITELLAPLQLPVIAVVAPGVPQEEEALHSPPYSEVLYAPLDGNNLAEILNRHLPFELRLARVPFCTHVTIQDTDGLFYGVSGNVSIGGLFVATFDRLPHDEEIRLQFTLSEYCQTPIAVQGRVVWRNSKVQPVENCCSEGFGVEFTDISGGDLDKIKDFVFASA